MAVLMMDYKQEPEEQTGRRWPNRLSRNQSYEQIIIQIRTLNSGSIQKPPTSPQMSNDLIIHLNFTATQIRVTPTNPEPTEQKQISDS